MENPKYKKFKYKCCGCDAKFYERLQFCPECCGVEFKTLPEFKQQNDPDVYDDHEQ
jgi:rRNA maturation endonuclease Nob1